MGKNNHSNQVHLGAYIGLFIAFLLVLSPLIGTIICKKAGLLETATAPEITAPETTTLEASTPDESTPEEPTESIPEETTESTPEETPPEEPLFPNPSYDGNGITADNALKCVNIITGDSESEIYAGEELADYLAMKNVAISDNGFPIIIFVDVTLEEDAFLIDAVLRGEGASMTIRGGNGRGVLYGVYRFLEKYAGVRYFMPGLERIPEGDIVLYDGNLLAYKPYFEFRHTSWHSTLQDTLWSVKAGVNGNGSLTPDIGGKISYGKNLYVHTLGWLTETGNTASVNPCLTSEENYQRIIKNIRKVLEEDPNTNIVSVSQNDRNEYCACENCTAVLQEEGSYSGLMLRLVNRVAEELEEDYPHLIIDTLAYNDTQKPPLKTVPRHNVCVRVCSIRVCFMHPMTECPDAKGPNGIQWTRTSEFLPDLIGWGKICDRIYVWDYTTNFAYYIAPFSNFGSLRQNMRLYCENGVRGMVSQGNHQSISGEFGELRGYLITRLMWDPYMSEEEYYAHMDEFLEAYYGAGWQGIRKYIDKTTELAYDGCINIYEEPLQSITEQEYLDNEADFEEWWNTAEELAGDRLEYVQRSRLQWRYIQLLLHPDEEACQQFVRDVENYGIRWAESSKNNKPINEMFPSLYPTNK